MAAGEHDEVKGFLLAPPGLYGLGRVVARGVGRKGRGAGFLCVKAAGELVGLGPADLVEGGVHLCDKGSEPSEGDGVFEGDADNGALQLAASAVIKAEADAVDGYVLCFHFLCSGMGLFVVQLVQVEPQADMCVLIIAPEGFFDAAGHHFGGLILAGGQQGHVLGAAVLGHRVAGAQ